jgi:hypothetical protein
LFTGVRRIAALEIEVDGEVMPECRDIFIAKNFLLFSGDHEINVSYEVDA